LQLAYLNTLNSQLGTVTDWAGFLNQYYWLLNYVDQQVDRVLEALQKSVHADNTIIAFTSDHGEFAGSHGLHNKGNAVYEEAIHVPLYVNFPGQTNSIAMNQMCSSVDIFGLLCDLATGGAGQWRSAYPDLANRQSLWSFLYNNGSETRTVPSGPLAGRPYIFHTSDTTQFTPTNVNAHIVCLRTKTGGGSPGAKLGVYSAWAPCTTIPDSTAQDFEFYDYATNPTELGNEYSAKSAKVQEYVDTLGTWGPPATGLIATELAKPLTGTGTDGNPLTQALAAAQSTYFEYLGQTCG
jgi:hypothetical protein